jgi:hypothetical protein
VSTERSQATSSSPKPKRRSQPYSKPYYNATVEKAHDVRALRGCDECGGLGNEDRMLHVDIGRGKVFIHGRCFVRAFGLESFVKLPQAQLNKMSLGDVGFRAMKAIVSGGHALNCNCSACRVARRQVSHARKHGRSFLR